MLALLASPLLKYGVMAAAALGLWGYFTFQSARIDRLKSEVSAVTAERALAVAAAHANEAAIAALKVEAERATQARAAVAAKLRASETRLTIARKAIENAEPTACAFPEPLRAVIDGLRRAPAAGSGDANQGRKGQTAHRAFDLPR